MSDIYVTVRGSQGSGKSTVAEIIADALVANAELIEKRLGPRSIFVHDGGGKPARLRAAPWRRPFSEDPEPASVIVVMVIQETH